MTMKKSFFLFLAVLICGGLLHAEEDQAGRNIRIDLGLRLYKATPEEGSAVFIRWISAKPVPAGATYFYTGNVKNESPRPEEAEIKKVFKASNLQVISDSDVTIDYDPEATKGKKDLFVIGWWDGYYGVHGPLLETVLSDEKKYAFRIIPISVETNSRRFKLQIFEPPARQVAANSVSAVVPSEYYVDADFAIPDGNTTTIIGFADSKGTAYFLSVRLVPASIIGGQLPGHLSDTVYGTPSAKVSQKIMEPETIKKVLPVYPESCRKNKIEGNVELAVAVDTKGRPEDVKVLHGVHPDLDKAAVDAVRKWVFKPYLVDGKPGKVVFKLNILFKLT